MKYTIVERDSFKVIGKLKKIDTTNQNDIPLFWNTVVQNGTLDQLYSINEGHVHFGICLNFDHQNNQFDYMIGINKPSEYLNNHYDEIEVPKSSWAVFDVHGDIALHLHKAWEKINTTSFPKDEYERLCLPELEVYYPGNPHDESYYCEIWIPVKEKVGK